MLTITRTPLHFAVSQSRNYDIFQALLAHGADLGSRDLADKTPLHTFFNPVVGTVILSHRDMDEEIFSPDSHGMTIVQYAAWSSKSEPLHLISCLRSAELYPFLARDCKGRSVIHFAAQRGNIAILRYLFDLPFDVGINIRDSSGQSALHYAVQSRRTETIDLLLSNGADINAADEKGRTILHCAAERNNLVAIERVLELCGKNILHTRDLDGITPAKLAYRRKAFSAAKYLNSLTAENLGFERQHRSFREENLVRSWSKLMYSISRVLYSSTYLVVVAVTLWSIFHVLT